MRRLGGYLGGNEEGLPRDLLFVSARTNDGSRAAISYPKIEYGGSDGKRNSSMEWWIGDNCVSFSASTVSIAVHSFKENIPG